MKLTKSQLNQIIREELEEHMVDEGVWDKFKGAVGLGKKAAPPPQDPRARALATVGIVPDDEESAADADQQQADDAHYAAMRARREKYDAEQAARRSRGSRPPEYSSDAARKRKKREYDARVKQAIAVQDAEDEAKKDYRKVRGAERSFEESKKITKSQLQRIIQEELENALNQ